MKRVVINNEFYRHPEVLDFIKCIPTKFGSSGESLFIGRNQIKYYVVGPFQVVVKQFKRPHLLQRIAYTFLRESKASRAYDHAHELLRRQISTPRPIAYIEEYRWGLFLDGYYISLHALAPSVKCNLLDSPIFDRELAKALAFFLAKLHQRGILHKDLNLSNILYTKGELGYTFSLIDINRMTFYPDSMQIPVYACFDNLTRMTGRMDLYRFIVRNYIEFRGWSSSLCREALRIKLEHDIAWRKRKDFIRKCERRYV